LWHSQTKGRVNGEYKSRPTSTRQSSTRLRWEWNAL